MCIIPNLIFFTIPLVTAKVVAWSCLVVASKLGLMAQCQIGVKVLVGACLSFWSYQFISNILEYIHVG